MSFMAPGTGRGGGMIISFQDKAIMKRSSAFMVKGEKVDVVAVHAVRGGSLFVTVRDKGGVTDYVDSMHVAFKAVRSKDDEIEAAPESVHYVKGN